MPNIYEDLIELMQNLEEANSDVNFAVLRLVEEVKRLTEENVVLKQHIKKLEVCLAEQTESERAGETTETIEFLVKPVDRIRWRGDGYPIRVKVVIEKTEIKDLIAAAKNYFIFDEKANCIEVPLPLTDVQVYVYYDWSNVFKDVELKSVLMRFMKETGDLSFVLDFKNEGTLYLN